ncbi:NAD-dependent epimerase/dehydratase family protein [Brenneria tiliae]|uniref:SDR family oxidoreductase n=1 Tax=Brenneria tiliae TaxID=2914984 RepID=A0ABT0MQJ3_9GAMM|nr:SDR family oxidoreductase [Brenneria tiliae]MCL2892109.1 SDR family oxidoreductase [Brenneria tiliae]
MNSTILVAGAGGYIGIPLCRLLARRGYRVIALDRFFFGPFPHELAQALNIKVLRGDIRDITPAMFNGVDAVIDLAGLSNDPAALISADIAYSINYQGACHLARTARNAGIRRYVYMSSASVYGRAGAAPATEDSRCNPQSLYAQLKLQVEQALIDLNGEDFRPVILRNATVFGLSPRMRYDLSVNIMTLMAIREQRVVIDGDGRQQRPFIHVEDVGRAVLLALRLDLNGISDPVFNIGGDELNHDINGIAACIAAEIPAINVVHRPQSSDSRDYRLCFERAREQLGFLPTKSIGDGVREIAHALLNDRQAGNQPTCFTAQWYLSLIEWEKRLQSLSLNGRIL